MDQIILSRGHYEAVKTLPADVRAEVYDAIFGRIFDDIEPRLSTDAYAVFLLLLRDIERQGDTPAKPPRRSKAKKADASGEDAPQGRFVPPTVEEIAAYCQERKNGINPQKFRDFYTSKGWMVGKTKMVDWKSCVRTWERDGGGAPRTISPQVGVDHFDHKYLEAFMKE